MDKSLERLEDALRTLDSYETFMELFLQGRYKHPDGKAIGATGGLLDQTREALVQSVLARSKEFLDAAK